MDLALHRRDCHHTKMGLAEGPWAQVGVGVEVAHGHNRRMDEGGDLSEAHMDGRKEDTGVRQRAPVDLTEGKERRTGQKRCYAHSLAEEQVLHNHHRSTTAALVGQAAGRRPRTPQRSPHFQVREVVEVLNGMQEARAPASYVA